MTPALQVDALTVTFGGHAAVQELSLTVQRGEIAGLIGPNGAGKSTTFNACTGLLKPAAGRIWMFGQEVTSLGPAARAQRGLGRTFQRLDLFESLTVRENVALGREAQLAGTRAWRVLWSSQSDRSAVRRATEESLDRCGITALAGELVADLSTGQRRLVELARVLAGTFPLLLLDEPSSGLDVRETEAFGRILQTAVREEGRSILLVEHDMTLVRQICDRLDVLDFGRHLIQGRPDEVLASDVVRQAYLGEHLDGSDADEWDVVHA